MSRASAGLSLSLRDLCSFINACAGGSYSKCDREEAKAARELCSRGPRGPGGQPARGRRPGAGLEFVICPWPRAAPRPLRGCSRPWPGSGRERPCLLVKEEGSAVRARGASYGRGAARSVAKRLRLSNEMITRAPRLRIGERAGAVNRSQTVC